MNFNASEIFNESNRNKFHLVKTNNCSYLDVPIDGEINQRNNETYDLQCTNDKIKMKITIIIECMSMHFRINMYISKISYQ